MSESHYQKVRAEGYTGLLRLLALFGLAGALSQALFGAPIINDWYSWILMIIGVMEMYSAFNFHKLEKVVMRDAQIKDKDP